MNHDRPSVPQLVLLWLMGVCMLGFVISLAASRWLTWKEYREGGQMAYWARFKEVMTGPTGWFLGAFLILAALERVFRP